MAGTMGPLMLGMVILMVPAFVICVAVGLMLYRRRREE
jgi:hypothetical protein